MATKPDSPKYYLGMIGALGDRFGKTSLQAALVASPDLLQHDVWKLFEYDGEGDNSLANNDRSRTSWATTFVSFMKQGLLPRAKLLECTIEALQRDFNHYRARWFHDFYDMLEPTEDELRAHADRFLGLLGATAPNVATWALNKVEHLAKSGYYEGDAFIHAIASILQARAKATVLRALKLLELQAAGHPEQHAAVAATAATALGHEKTDVQNAAIALLEKFASHSDAAVRGIVERHAGSVSASVRSRVAKWLAASDGESANASAGTSSTGTASTSASWASKSNAGVSRRKPAIAGNAKRTAKRADQQPTRRSAEPAIPGKLQTLLAIDGLENNVKTGEFSIPAATFDGTEIARLSERRKLDPIDDIEELLDVCARVIEDGSLVDDAERCIDGLCRLCDSKPDDFQRLTGPILKRVRGLIKKRCSPFFGLDPGNDILGLVYAFCTGEVIEPSHTAKSRSGTSQATYTFEGEKLGEYVDNMSKPIGFLSLRALEVARRVARRQACQLLSTATHQHGWVDPRELARRVGAWSGEAPDATDVILAILRLAPEHRAAGLKAIENKPAEWVQAIRYALGADKVSIGKQAPLWVAAARARSPWEDDPRVVEKFSDLGPDSGSAAQVAFRFKSRKSGGYTFVDVQVASSPAVPKTVDPLLVTVAMHAYRGDRNMLMFELGGFAGKTNGAVRWTATIWPVARESYFAGCAQDCLDNLDWSGAEWQNRTTLEPLLDPTVPLRYAGLILLTGMLGAKEPGESGLATDIAIRAIEDGRLGSDNLGRGLSELLSSGLIKPGRWQKTLSEVARTSPVHAAVIQIALQHCFTKDTSKTLPKDSAKLLELLYELSIESGLPISNEACQTYLAKSEFTGKTAKFAKSLSKLVPSDGTQAVTQAILANALEQRIAAAKRHALANCPGD